MAVRKDQIQLEVEINGKKAGSNLRELRNTAKNLKRELELVRDPKTKNKLEKELKRINDILATSKSRTKGVAKGLNEMRIAGVKLPGIFQKVGRSLNSIGILAVIAAIATGLRKLKEFGSESLKAFDIQAKADAQAVAAIESTNAAAGRSFEQLTKQAQDLQKITLFGDEQIQGAQNVLLTFTNVREEIFDRSIPAILNVSTALKTDLKSASIQVGKALNDPVKGLSALGKAGVQFTDEQKKVVKQLVDTNQTAKAQEIILKELETQFAGSAEAAAKAGTGPYEQFKNRVADITEKVGELINKGLELLLPAFNKAATFADGFLDVLLRAPANFAGFQAAARQSIDNVGEYFNGLIRNAKVFAKELELALTINSDTRKQLRAELAALELEATIAAKSGKTVGEAFAEARDAALEKSDKERAERAAKNATKLPGAAPADGGSSPGNSAEAAAALEKKKFDARLKEQTAYLEKQKLLLESDRLQGAIDENEYQDKIQEIKKNSLQEQLATYAEFGKSQSNEAIKINNQLLQIEQNLAQAKQQRDNETSPVASLDGGTIGPVASTGSAGAEQIANESAVAEALLKQRLERAIISEQEYNEALLQIRKAAADQQIINLIETGQIETETFRNAQLEKLDIEKQISDQRIENVRRENELKNSLNKQGLDVAKEGLSTVISLLSQDEKARKKHAGVIKAFEIAKVKINLASEIQGIWRNANNNPANALFPGAAQVIAIAKTAFAIGRSGVQISKIQRQAFATGGKAGFGRTYNTALKLYSGQKITDDANIPTQSNGDNIIGTLRKGEVVLNEGHIEKAGGPDFFNWLGVPGFADGGLTTVDTTPTANDFNLSQTAGSAEVVDQMKLLNENFQRFPTRLKAVVDPREVNDFNNELDEVENASSF